MGLKLALSALLMQLCARKCNEAVNVPVAKNAVHPREVYKCDRAYVQERTNVARSEPVPIDRSIVRSFVRSFRAIRGKESTTASVRFLLIERVGY